MGYFLNSTACVYFSMTFCLKGNAPKKQSQNPVSALQGSD